ncbi:MAG TPA: aspartate/glutamate racemase family protein [Deltaproteobacteria bacterium]|nr:aspartate/glutamate racemase family protein [Deltaproteobacteria bacterium]
MKTIGLLGGMSWESSTTYYQIINEAVREKLGGLHSAKCIMASVDFAEIEILQSEGKWKEAALVLSQSAIDVENGGADFLILCTNTMHKIAAEIQQSLSIPLLHIADATAQRIKSHGIKRIGLLGTRFTMEEDFYKGRLIKKYGFDVIIPEDRDRKVVDDVIYNELCLGKIYDASRRAYQDIIQGLITNGAEGIILGCTEIGLLVKQEGNSVPFFDTARIHAEAAVAFALEEN